MALRWSRDLLGDGRGWRLSREEEEAEREAIRGHREELERLPSAEERAIALDLELLEDEREDA